MQTDYLQFAASMGAGHENLIPLFKRAMKNAGTAEIVDLCSGGTGPWMHLKKQLEKAGLPVSVRLTDKYPDPEALLRLPEADRKGIIYINEPVDAMKVPRRLKGMRTFFEGFHHFKPEQAVAILQDAVDSGAAIGVFDAALKPPFGLILLALSPFITFLTYLLVTPFLKPRRLSRFIWTYLIPVVPVLTCWDGIISLLRVYSAGELKELTAKLKPNGFSWESGLAETGTPVFLFSYLVGYPAASGGNMENNEGIKEKNTPYI